MSGKIVMIGSMKGGVSKTVTTFKGTCKRV